MSRRLLAAAVSALCAGAVAAPAAAVIVTTAPGAPDPGAAAGEILLVSFDVANVAGVTDFNSGAVMTASGSNGSRAAPAGTLKGGVYRSLGTGASSLFDFSAWTGGRGLRSASFYWGSVDTYNFVDFLNGAGTVIGSIGGGKLPMANGNQSLRDTNRRVFFGFDPSENVMALRLRSTGVAFEFDSIAARAIDPIVPRSPNFNAAGPATGAVPEPATWAMLIIGFCLVGAAMRRRKPAAVSA